MKPETRVAIQIGTALGVGLVVWEIGQEWMIGNGLGRPISVFGSGAVAALVAGSIHWLAGKFLPVK